MKNPARGFTLVELLVVISIIAILSVVGVTMYSGVQSKARDAQRLDDARKIITALEQYKSGAGKYPIAADVLNSVDAPATWLVDLDVTNFKGNVFPKDPVNANANYSGGTVATSPKNQAYYYKSTNGTDYCLEIPQENNVSGHPNYAGKPNANNTWFLHFGPNANSSGDCTGYLTGNI